MGLSCLPDALGTLPLLLIRLLPLDLQLVLLDLQRVGSDLLEPLVGLLVEVDPARLPQVAGRALPLGDQAVGAPAELVASRRVRIESKSVSAILEITMDCLSSYTCLGVRHIFTLMFSI